MWLPFRGRAGKNLEVVLFTQSLFSTIWIFNNVWHDYCNVFNICQLMTLKWAFSQSFSAEDFLKTDSQMTSYTIRQLFSIFYFFFPSSLLFLCSDSFFLCFIVVFILFSCSVFFLADPHIAESHINWLALRASTGAFTGPCYTVIKLCWVMKYL